MTDQSYVPTISGLRAFVAVAQHRHFGTAATSLGISQPTLSQALAGLEAGLGRALVERSTRRVFLTENGERLLPAAERVVDAVTEFSSAASGSNGSLAGTIRLGLIPTIAPYILPGLLAGMAERLPGLRLRVVEDQTSRLLDALRSGAIDVAMLALPTDASGLVEIPMYQEDFVLALPAGHPLSGRKRVSPDSLADLPLLLLDEGHCLRDQALEVCRLAGVRPDVGPTRAASLATAVQCVAGGLGVTLIPRTAVAVEVERGPLTTAEFAGGAARPGRRIGLVARPSSPRLAEFREFAEAISATVDEGGAVRRLSPK